MALKTGPYRLLGSEEKLVWAALGRVFVAAEGPSFLPGSLFPFGFCFSPFLCGFPPLLMDTLPGVHIHQPWTMLLL